MIEDSLQFVDGEQFEVLVTEDPAGGGEGGGEEGHHGDLPGGVVLLQVRPDEEGGQASPHTHPQDCQEPGREAEQQRSRLDFQQESLLVYCLGKGKRFQKRYYFH